MSEKTFGVTGLQTLPRIGLFLQAIAEAIALQFFKQRALNLTHRRRQSNFKTRATGFGVSNNYFPAVLLDDGSGN